MIPLPYTVTLDELSELLQRFPFDRPIQSLRLHLRCDSRAQVDRDSHIRVQADGIWLNRGTWRWRASENGTEGAALIVEVGCGAEGKFSRSVKESVLKVVARIQLRFGLAAEAVTIVSPTTLSQEDASEIHEGLNQTLPLELKLLKNEEASRSPVSNFPFPAAARSVWTLIDRLRSGRHLETEPSPRRVNLLESSLPSDEAPLPSSNREEPLDEPRAIELTTPLKQELRAHVVDLVQGRFSQEGWKTQSGDVDTIFRKHIREWAATRPADETLRIVIYAHGGIVSEAKGLELAALQMQWWKDNGAYPIFFVWETGLLETLCQLINPDRERGIDFAAPTDFLLEHAARALGGVIIWSGMKRSAERASDGKGGAFYTATELVKLLRDELGRRFELHAVGHSAGSIFHSHFINAALQAGVRAFDSLTLLAPAITVEAFKERLLPLIRSQAIKRTVIFTLSRPFEMDDNCMGIYRKSLLYLIRAALEPEPHTPILGLEESIRQDSELMRVFDPDGPAGSRTEEIIFSKTQLTSGRSASQSTSHGGFDDDAATMESVVRRIMNRDDIKPFPGRREVRASRERSIAPEAVLLTELLRGRPDRGVSHGRSSQVQVMASSLHRSHRSASKRALCVGIDRYRDHPLGGCVNDARQWENALRSLGFSTETLLDEDATRDAILERLSALISESRAGDQVVFQYAGHGTQLTDLDGDEEDSYDEALCPIDYSAGRFLIDDDLAAIFDRIPDGVNVTVFTDCCHSGTITRFAVGKPSARSSGVQQRVRFMVATPALEAAHQRDRQQRGRDRAPRSKRTYREAKEVLFSACRAVELARESNGHGDFTTRVVPLLTQAKAGITHEQFERAILNAFANSVDQHPELHCAPERRGAVLLSLSEHASLAAEAEGGSAPPFDRHTLRRALELVVDSLR